MVPNDETNHCTGVIPGTFIACGEGGNYCSEECMQLDFIRRVKETTTQAAEEIR